MASGHVNRTNRPNTWLHRPACGREESPCQLGAVHTCALCGLKPDISRGPRSAQKPTLTCEQIQNIRGRSCNDRYLAGSQRGRFHRLWTVSRVSEGRANAYRDATAPEAV